MLSPTSVLDLRTTLPSSVVRAVKPALEKRNGKARMMVLKAVAAMTRPSKEMISRSEMVSVVLSGRVRDVNGFEEWLVDPSERGRTGSGMNVAVRMCIELPNKERVVEERTLVGEVMRRAEMASKAAAADSMSKKELSKGML